MKIALYHNLPAGGARRMFYELVRRSALDHEYHLFDPEPDSDDQGTTSHDLRSVVKEVHPVQGQSGRIDHLAERTPLRPWANVVRIREAERRAARLMSEDDFDLVVVHSCQYTHSPLLLTDLRPPTLYYVHEPRRRSFETGYRTSVSRRSGLARAAWRVGAAVFEKQMRGDDRRAVAAATALATNSLFSREAIARAYGRDARVCYPGVDVDLFTPALTGPDDAGAHPFVVTVGALDPSKGHHLVVEALALLPASERPALHVVHERGDESYARQLSEAASDAGVELRLHKGVSDGELVILYRKALATVAAAHLEPFGLTPLESISAGTPVVAFEEGGYRETVRSGVNGYLVERTPAALAAGIASIRAGQLARTPEQIRETVVGQWTWDATVARMHQLYADVVADVAR